MESRNTLPPGLRNRRFGAAAKKRGAGLAEAEGRRVHPGTGRGKTCFGRALKIPIETSDSGRSGGGDGNGPAAAARGPKVSPRREGRPLLLLPPPSGFCASRHSKIGERRFLTAFPGASPVLLGFPVPRRCCPPLPSPAHGTLPVSEICRRYPPASVGFLEVMGAGC